MMRAVAVLAAKDLRVLLRSKGDLFFTLGWPLLLAVFFGVIFAGPPKGRSNLAVAVVDEDASAGSRAFVERLRNAAGLSVDLATRAAAIDLVRQGKRTAYVVLPAGFGAASRQPFFGGGANVELGVDPSRTAEAAMLEGLLMQQAATGLREALSDRTGTREMVDEARSALSLAPGGGRDDAATLRFLGELGQFLESRPGGRDGGSGSFRMLTIDQKPVAVETQGPRSSFDFTFPQGILWGVLGCASTFGIGLVAERTRGTLVRLQAAPLSRAQILGGKALACLLAILGVEAALVAIGILAFGVRPSSYPLLALAGFASAIGFVGIMMALSTLGQTEKSASGAAWAVLLVMSMLGGGMVPLFVMPPWMATASHLSPIKWAILAFEGALWRGFGPAEMLLPCAILVAVGVSTFALGAKLFRAA